MENDRPYFISKTNHKCKVKGCNGKALLGLNGLCSRHYSEKYDKHLRQTLPDDFYEKWKKKGGEQ